jgi:GH15 family glucan-1,4-alpha-glucosidase
MARAVIEKNTFAPIESYALIGDCETAALVGLDGSIDWLCWPDFSSDACFARLLGSKENGRWLLAPVAEEIKTTRKYREHTLILETTFETADFAVMIIDFMPIRGANSDIVRIVKGIRGSAPMQMELSIRFDYGATVPWVTRSATGIHAIAGPDLVVLRTKAPLAGEDLTTVSEFTVNEGESVDFVMTYGRSHLHAPRAIDVIKALAETQSFWEEWAAQCNYQGPYREVVERSLITLKALTYRPTGGIVAAVTTSLPEQLGGPRNWDYRYCWLRDATFTLDAFMHGGYYQEAKAWQQWLLRAIAGSPEQVQIMYGIGGERYLPERELAWLPGYEDSKPVRIGNAASEQLQLDIYGEVLGAFHQALSRLGKDGEVSFAMLRGLVEHLETIWQQPDEALHLFQDDGLGRLRSGHQGSWNAACRRSRRKVAKSADENSRRNLQPGIQRKAGQFCPELRVRPAGCVSPADAHDRLSPCCGSASRRYPQGDRAAADVRRPGIALQHCQVFRWASPGRGGLSRLQFLDGTGSSAARA